MAKYIEIRVGILASSEIKTEFHGGYMRTGNLYQPTTKESFFTLENVTIGKGFHWERTEKQRFLGSLELIKQGNLTLAVNILPMEIYLESVISSEMAATSHPQLLMAHAIISRTWALARIKDRRNGRHGKENFQYHAGSDNEIIKWYGSEGHTDFDVCADDHCQRYQGISRITRDEVSNAVRQTRGKILVYDGELCDARYSKCCGGAFEEFGACWEDEDHPYLKPGLDMLPERGVPDLTVESNAQEWIMSRPESFCSGLHGDALKRNLNSYDIERFSSPDNDFYRWKIFYRPGEIEKIIQEKSGYDIGELIELIPVKRGKSGRIVILEIVGSKKRIQVGKELEIRKWLSRSHLPSSAFISERNADGGWTFNGAGWGHGVGLCQTGAAEMARLGYNYRQILGHYYPGANIEEIK